MRTQALLASLGLLAGVSKSERFDCGTSTDHASSDFIQAVQSLHSGTASGSMASRAALYARDASPITIDVVFHIAAKESTKSSITDDMPKAQLDSLNASYNPYSIYFNLINVTWTTNDDWAVGGGDPDTAMKQSLRQGTYKTLNLYFQTDLAGGVLGKCTLPSAIANGKSDPSVYWSDGCNINAHTMPAGAMAGYNSGKTAVHETGHWMGLLHTFEGYSCDGDGDFIDDTPMEKTATDGCPKDPVKKTCPDQQGKDESDPIHNYMDYSIDECYTGFSDLQVTRMRSMWGMYRDGN